ncbi:LRR receptor-like serine/threonine-protein kinase FLS2 [Hevea brasiliensis]|uniref:LRR receptor-like serine/threonine-protein kinase FLS2 n=1 Tax=Hevea brasiliensis TaxID=3981 RepID=UPI0025CF9465|nr:LRR receptor-like serine/threonine-protein kinase FLS2 [Hevea brasiliensis]
MVFISFDKCPKNGVYEVTVVVQVLTSPVIFREGAQASCMGCAGSCASFGSIPKSLFNLASLSVLSMQANGLTGEIPAEIGSLVALQILDLGNNGLKGTFPISLFNCSSLGILSFDELGLTGTIPSEIGELRNLEYLNLKYNSLTGTIPSPLFNMTALRIIGLESNRFSGRLPSEFGHSLPNLEEIYIWSNQFSGQLPSSISNCSKLTIVAGVTVALGANSFSGPIPNSLGNLRNLEVLNIPDNLFTDESSVCKALTRLALAGNPLNGTLPISISNFSAVHYFDAQSCNIKGNIAREVGQLSNLTILKLQNNELVGSIPATLGRLQKLQVMHLQGNKLNGSLPNDICQMSSLGELILSRNNLSGALPACLGDAFLGNDELWGSPLLQLTPCKISSHGRSKTTTKKVLLYILPAMILIIVVILVSLRCQKATVKIETVVDPDLVIVATWRRISFQELEKATDGFCSSNLLGTGGFGTVYKGRLGDGMDVAVKVFNLQLEGAFKSFDAECEVMSKNAR